MCPSIACDKVDPARAPGGARAGAPTTLDAHDLSQCVHDLHQIRLRGHDGIDVLVGHRRFIDHACILAALDAARRRRMSLQRKAPLSLPT
jgi:hypothetical protein